VWKEWNMSILIKGVSLDDFKPTVNCPCLNGEYGYCDIPGIKRCYGIGKDGCPLIEIPPHGDLIDRNKLYEKTAEWEAQALHMVEVTMHDEDTTEWRKWSTVLTERSAFKFDVADAPTIIPAEEEQT
jgi:hypothetical protein